MTRIGGFIASQLAKIDFQKITTFFQGHKISLGSISNFLRKLVGQKSLAQATQDSKPRTVTTRATPSFEHALKAQSDVKKAIFGLDSATSKLKAFNAKCEARLRTLDVKIKTASNPQYRAMYIRHKNTTERMIAGNEKKLAAMAKMRGKLEAASTRLDY